MLYVIYDSAGELHVMIQHVDQRLVQQCVIQKYCSETEKRQQRRSITPQLHVVHSGILPSATAYTPHYITAKSPPATLYNRQEKYAFLSDTLYSLLLS